jgi:acetyl esterase/lipase
MTKLYKTALPFLCVFLWCGCASKKVSDLPYLKNSVALVESYPKLDIYHPRKSESNPVVIFIHGGYWEEGKKDIYSFLGRGFANKDIVTVIPSYTLSPDGNYNTMAQEVAAAIEWTRDSISKYNGNPQQIFLMGHSAGGHLIALVGTNPKYLASTDVIKGLILNDAAALDMNSYLKQHPPTKKYNYNVTWTQDSTNWIDASPIYHLSKKTPPCLIYVGTKTYPSILTQNKDFLKELNKYQPAVDINYLTKKHVPMMSQYAYPWNKHYTEIMEFIGTNK